MPLVPDYTVEVTTWAQSAVELGALRMEVFVREQGFAAEIEMDGRDAACVHLAARTAKGEVIGTARLLPDGHIGRVAVKREFRSQGVGRALMRAAIEAARERGFQSVELDSQVPAVPFYERLGFEPVGEIFVESGAPHRKMVLTLNQGV